MSNNFFFKILMFRDKLVTLSDKSLNPPSFLLHVRAENTYLHSQMADIILKIFSSGNPQNYSQSIKYNVHVSIINWL